MLTGFFLTGRLPVAGGASGPAGAMARRLSLGLRGRRGALPGDALPDAGADAGAGVPPDVLPGAPRLAPLATPAVAAARPASGTAPSALSAASEAERVRRLRASFEDDLAHFLRSGTTAASD